MTDVLALSEHLPEIELGPDEEIIREGVPRGAVWILVSGTLGVTKDGRPLSSVAQPGAMFGEVSVLLGTPPAATVKTVEPSTLRYATDGKAFLLSDPTLARMAADGLAERLDFAASYLADLKARYGDAPGLTMVPEVLDRLSPSLLGEAADR